MKYKKDIDIIPIVLDKFPSSIEDSNIEIVMPILSSIDFSDDILKTTNGEFELNDTRNNTYTFKYDFDDNHELSYYDRILIVIPNKAKSIEGKASLYMSFWYNIQKKYNDE